LRWSDSGFKNPHFVDFHHRLIEQNFDNNQVNLFKLKAGDTTLAILYFLLDGETAYFYLQGVNYEENGKFKPGLIAHTLAIEYFIGKGYLFYDFMGGKSQYKTQLSSHTTDLTTLLIQRPKTIFQLENMARNIKQKILEPGQKET
jgi:CelD/BcsL family acetyltransferase involved in cellulose biosynthesis